MSELSYSPTASSHFLEECHALYRGDLNTDPIEDDTAYPIPHKTTLRFVLWTHKAENLKNIIPLLKGCAILAVEDCQDTVFKTKEQINTNVALIEKKYHHLTQILQNKSLDHHQKLKLIHDQHLSDQDTYEILKRYADEITMVSKLDVGPADAQGLAILDQITSTKKAALKEVVRSSLASWAQLKDHSLAFIRARTNAEVYREEIVITQLKKLATENPGSTIAVLIGRAHHTITGKLTSDTLNIQRLIAKDETLTDISPFNKQWIDNLLVASDALRIGYDPDVEIQQIVLYEMVDYYGEPEMTSSVAILNASAKRSLANQLALLWQTSLPETDTESNKRARARINATVQLLQRVLVDDNEIRS